MPVDVPAVVAATIVAPGPAAVTRVAVAGAVPHARTITAAAIGDDAIVAAPVATIDPAASIASAFGRPDAAFARSIATVCAWATVAAPAAAVASATAGAYGPAAAVTAAPATAADGTSAASTAPA